MTLEQFNQAWPIARRIRRFEDIECNLGELEQGKIKFLPEIAPYEDAWEPWKTFIKQAQADFIEATRAFIAERKQEAIEKLKQI